MVLANLVFCIFALKERENAEQLEEKYRSTEG
jgi:hypothetical protein